MSRLFRINGLGGNCSHVIDSSTSYTYPFLPVGVSGHSAGLDGKVRLDSGIVKEHNCSTHWARSDQRHRSLGPMDQVVRAGEGPSKKIWWSKKTKVTKANQNGNWPRAVRLAPSQEHIVIETQSCLEQTRKWCSHCNRTCRRIATRRKSQKHALRR